VASLGHQQADQLAPHSGAATGDDGNPAGEFFHRTAPCVFDGSAIVTAFETGRQERTVLSPLLRLYEWALPSVRDWPGGPMPSSLYAYVLEVSRQQQVRLGLLTLVVFPLSLAPLELQRRIINYAVAHAAVEMLLALGGL